MSKGEMETKLQVLQTRGSKKYIDPEDKKGTHQWRWMPSYEHLMVIVILGDFHGLTTSFPQTTNEGIGCGGTELVGVLVHSLDQRYEQCSFAHCQLDHILHHA
jgi:hypothetical protein